jgi:hypothetical protein
MYSGNSSVSIVTTVRIGRYGAGITAVVTEFSLFVKV